MTLASLIAAYRKREHEIAVGDGSATDADKYLIWCMPDEVIAGYILTKHASVNHCLELLEELKKNATGFGSINKELAQRLYDLINSASDLP